MSLWVVNSMNNQELRQKISNYSSRALEQRKNWYSPAAAAYQQARPSYPKRLLDQVIDIAQLSCDSKILEVGCGPATATLSFASVGCEMLCLEPNPDFYQLAVKTCQNHPQIEIQNTSFEEWKLQAGQFDAVLAATSFHWIPAEIGYLKAAQALKPEGVLILLWNKQLWPSEVINSKFSEIYQIHAPELDHYEDQATQLKIVEELGAWVTESGQFQDVVAGHVESAVTFTAEQYLTLLQTYSPYLELEEQCRNALFSGLRDFIADHLNDRLPLSYLSAFHIARKR